MEQTTEVQELSLEKVINSKLVQSNVTDQVIAALKEKYSGLKLKELDDKESYLEIKAAAKDCAKVRTLAVKICTEGREEAVKTQKAWIATQKRVVGEVAEIEEPLCAEIDRFDAEVERKANEEKKRQEEAYINRQAALTKMGAVYMGGSFVLGEADFEAELIKGSSQDVWEEAVLPKFQAEYEKIEAVRIAAERHMAAEAAELQRLKDEFLKEQQEFKEQMEAMQKEKAEAQRLINEKLAEEKREIERLEREAEYERRKIEHEKLMEEKAKAEIEAAVKREAERLAEEQRLAEVRKQQEAAKKAEELAQASDKVKYANLIQQIEAIELPDMRSGQYRRKVAVIREKVEEILAL